MPDIIRAILESRTTVVAARVLLTFPFWGSGLDKLVHVPATVAEMRHFGLEPALAYAIATIVVELVGSVLVIANRWSWLGAGALGVFTALTIPIVHRFWALDGEAGMVAFHTAAEHVGMIGGLVAVAILATRRRPAPVEEPVQQNRARIA